MLGQAALEQTVAWLLAYAQALAGHARGSADAAAGAALRPGQALRSALRPDGRVDGRTGGHGEAVRADANVLCLFCSHHLVFCFHVYVRQPRARFDRRAP